jgi:outer membrane autotransporter protein
MSYDAHTSNILSWGRVQQRELQQRSMRCERFQYTPLSGTVTDSPCGSRSVIPWTKVLGSSGQNNPSGNTGYDSLTGGLLAGIDYRWSEQLWLSASMGYGTVEIDHDIGGDSDFKSIDVGVAAGTVRGPLTVRGSFSYSHGFHDITRDIDFLGTRFEGQFDSDRTSVALGAGYRVKLGPLVIEPNAMLDFSHVEEGRVKEKGGSDGSLDVRSRTTDLFSATAGLQFSTHILKYRYSGELLEWADGLWVPTIRTQWRQAVGSDDRSRVASLQGASASAGSFKSKASDSASGFEVAAHLSFQPMKSGNAIEIGYDGFFADDVTNHAANVTLRIPF